MISFILAVILICQTGCSPEQTQKYQKTEIAMGTVVTMTVYTSGTQGILNELFEKVDAVESNMLSRRIATSEIGRLNTAGEEGVPLTEECAEILQRSLQISLDSKGAFTPLLGKVITLWNIDEQAENGGEGKLPSPEDISDAMEQCREGSLAIVKQEDGYRANLSEGIQIDLGAVGKGASLDVLYEVLQTKTKVSGAVIAVGGSVLAYGEKPDGTPWKIGIVDPFSPEESLGVLTIPSGYCVSTSGDYQRYIEVDGKRYHHILNGNTGYPAESGVRSVTILCESGLDSDALSTACFVLGAEEGMALALKYGAEALFVTDDGAIHMTAGMEDYFSKTE